MSVEEGLAYCDMMGADRERAAAMGDGPRAPMRLGSVALVVPTVRPDSFRDFLAAWGTPEHRFWRHLVIVEGADKRTRGLAPPDAVHVANSDIDRMLGNDSWIISRHDSARRCFGFWLAWRLGAEYVVTLDDDTRPIPGRRYIAEHFTALDSSPRWISSVPGLLPRGLPYRNRGRASHVMLNMGLWSGTPDLDAARSLVEGTPDDYVPPDGNWLIPAGQYAPLCGMNLAFRRDVAPLAYFGLNGDPWPFGRFDDMTFGVIAKRIFDRLNWRWSVGRPWVEHRRASDPFRNLSKEAVGVGWFEDFWEHVDRAPLSATDPPKCMRQVGEHLATVADSYTAKLGEAIRIWASLFDA